ncbi:MAG: fluoride efflux transporter CrcB [Bacteroidetes bacterium]|nr:fluoride efflux transporter CrcB [Bacteroidota bacterium]
MKEFLLVAIGGMVGASLRYLISLNLAQAVNTGFPVATLLINLSGCLLIGLLYGNFSGTTQFGWIQPLLMIGLLGGFTTFSSFSLESINLLKSGAIGNLFVYLLASNLGGLSLAWLGIQWAAK